MSVLFRMDYRQHRVTALRAIEGDVVSEGIAGQPIAVLIDAMEVGNHRHIQFLAVYRAVKSVHLAYAGSGCDQHITPKMPGSTSTQGKSVIVPLFLMRLIEEVIAEAKKGEGDSLRT